MNSTGDDGVEWTVLILRLPSEPSRHRVAVWRELRRVGAIQLGQGCWALPIAATFDAPVTKLVELVADQKGDVWSFAASPTDRATRDRIRALYDDARRDEWTEFESECGKCLAELAREIENRKFTLAELDEEEQNVDRIRRWHRELRSRDIFEAVPHDHTQRLLDACIAELEQFTTLVYTAVGVG